MSGQRYSVTIDVGANINQVKSAAAEMQKIFSSMNLDTKNTSGITRLFNNLDKALSELQQKSNTALTGITDSRQVEKSVEKVNGVLNSLMQEFQSLGQNAPKELAQAISGFSEKMSQAAQKQNEYNKSIKETRAQAKKLSEAEIKAAEKVTAAEKARNDNIEKQKQLKSSIRGYKGQITKRNSDEIRKNYQEQIQRNQEEINKIAQKANARTTKVGLINEGDIKKLSSEDLENYRQLADILKKAQEGLEGYDKQTSDISKTVKSKQAELEKLNSTLKEQETNLQNAQTDWEKAQQAVKDFNQAGKESEAFNKLKENLTKVFNEESIKDVKNIEELDNALKQLADTAGGDVSSKIEKVRELLSSTDAPMKDTGKVIRETTEEFQRLGETNEELDHLTYRLKYFFSLAGGFNLMRRAIRSAVTTTKELDAVMTQTAVVSEYTVGDMWKTLPKYSKEAKKLGTAIKDVYGAQTLYVQQGLDMNSAMDLGVETLKMARVAGIGAEEATNSMTAALRGFNMELTETSAKRVNDVYSKLAQNTASNTQEISTAMTKTAALANSANMSFENTAAFLATIIESTREGAETAGTALKTVIARFTEVKKLYSENELTGTDEEGQEVDVNKISTALKTAGINMNEFFTGAKGLDEIFKELGSKWDSLTTVQQRYIATQAAGSRQQSRFLALMQNYSRTVELTNMAYNSAGSGQEQFEKTLDSLEAKINQFKDTWDTLIMGIANSDMIKGFIDFGTQILEVFNNIIEALSGGNGLIKSISSLALAFGTFKLGRGIFGKNGILGALISKDPSKLGSNFGKTFIGGFQKSITQQVQGGQAGAVRQYLGGYFYQNFGINKNELGFTIGNRGVEQAQAAYENYIKQLEGSRETSRMLYGNPDITLEQDERENLKKEFYQKSGLTKEQADKVLENGGIKQSITDYNALGNAAMLAGTAVYGVTTALEANGKIGEKTAGVIKGISTGLIAMGGAMKIVTALGKTFGFTTSLAAPIGLAIGATALIASVYDALTESEKEKTERYKKQVEESSEYLNSLKDSYKNLEESIDSISSKEDAFDGLIKGTKEWDEAVKDLNTSVSTLVEKYPELVKALEYNENGVLTLNKNTAKGILEDYKNKVTDATYMNIASKNLLNEQNSRNKEQSVITGGFNRLNIIDIESEEAKKVKKAILSGIKEGLLTELTSFTEADIDAVNSEGYKKLTSLLSDYLTKQGITDFSLDSALLKGAVVQEKYRQVEEQKNNQLLADSLEQRQKIIEDIFTAEAGTIKQLALEGTERAYKKAYDSFEPTGNYPDEIPYLKRFVEARGGTWDEDKPWYYKDAEGKPQKIEKDAFKSFMQTAQAFDAVEEASKATQKWFSLQTKEVKDFVNGVGKRSDLINPEIEKAFDGLDDGLFDYSDIKNKWQQEYNQIDRSIAKALNSNIFDQIDKLNEQIEKLEEQPSTSERNDEIQALVQKRNELLSTLTLSTLDLGISAYDKIGQLITTASNNQGTAAASKLASSITSVLGGIGNYETRNTVASKLYEVNWSTIKNVDDLKEALNELGATALESVEGFEELAKQLIETQKVLKTLSLKDLQKEAKERLDLRDSLKSATSATFDEDTYKKLIKAGATRSDFIYTGQGYTYTKGELKGLGKVLEDNLGTVIEDTKNNLQNQIKAGEIFEKATEGFVSASEEVKKFLSGELTEEDSNVIRSILKEGLDIDELYNEKTGEWMKLEDLSAEALVNLYQKTLEYSKGQQERKDQIADIDKNAPFFGRTADYVRQNGGDVQQQIAAAISDAERAGFNVNELTNYAQQLSQVNTTLQDTTGNANELAYAIAYDNMLMNQGISELSSNYSNWEKILEKAAEDEKVKSTIDYANTIVGLREALQKITGTTVEFSEEFLTAKENLDLFKKAAKGDTNAINQLRKSAAKGILQLDGKGQLADQLNQWISDVDLDNIKIGAELDTNVADVFQGLIDAGILTAEQVNQALESIGYEPNVEMVEMEGSAASKAHTHAYLRSSDGGYTEITGEENIAQQESVFVPVIGGSTKGKKAGVKAPTYKGGADSTLNRPPKSGGGGGGKKDFKNDFDKYYNIVEDINELIRQRNLLESDYNQLLKAEGTTGADIYKNLQKQLKLLEERRKLTADLAEKRKQQLLETMQADEYKDVAQYARWNEEDQTIEIDWEAINKIKDSELGNLVKEYIKKLEELQGQYDEQIEGLEELQNLYQEILKERGRQEYKSLEDRVRDALIKQIQDKIDELQAVGEAINETNQKLFDSISQTLELQRQERTNAKTEEDLSDKEKRLAYLQQDSSNANAVEIAQLQEELADARQDYTDSLIDQKISELQRQNDEAQEQRQQQIELMQQSLDWQEKNGEFWQQVYSLISEGIGPNGSLVTGSDLDTLLKTGEGWQSLSKFGKMEWLNNLENLIAQAVGFLANNRQLEDLGVKEGTQITFTNKEGNKLTGTVDKNGNVVVQNPNGTTTTYTGVYQDYAGNYHTVEDTPEPDKTGTETPEKPPEKETYKYEKYSSKKHWKIKFVEGKEKEKTKEKHTFKDNVCTKCGYKKKKKSGKTGEDDETTVQGGDNGDSYEDGYERPGGTHETYVDKDGNTHHIYKDADGKIYYSYVEKAGQESTTTTGTQTPDKDDHVHEPDPGSDFWKPGEKKWYWTATQHWQEWIATNTRTGLEKLQQSQKESHNFIETDEYKQCNKCGYKVVKPQKPVDTPPSNPEPEEPQSPQPPPPPDSGTGTPQKPQNTPKPPARDSQEGTTEGKWIPKSYNWEKSENGHRLVTKYENSITKQTKTETGSLQAHNGDPCTVCGYHKKFNKFFTGGLVDSTGPAWLDGSKSQPELVLNARDTQNFIELKDTLASIKSNGSLNLNGGNSYYDIKVQVDSLGSDYDVDKAIDRIKTRIAQENAYRNVNTLSRLR